MKTLYRVCPFESPNILSVCRGDKDTMIDLCLQSLIKAGADDITFLVDRMDLKRFEKYGEVIDCSGLGNVGTFHKQLELGQKYEKVFFSEDDYIWRPDTFKLLEEAVDQLDFVSPYDHPAHYIEERFDKHYEMKLIGSTVYREAPSNTLTFATTKRVLSQVAERMWAFGIADHPMFDDLRKTGLRIWNPTHSFATHLAENCIAPNVDWTALLKTSK